MPAGKTTAADWQDWTDPGYFEEAPRREARFLPIFLRQLMPARRRRTRLTATGWMLVLVCLGIGSAAYNTSSNILFLTLAVLLSSLILSGLLSALNFRGLSWTLRAPARLRAGEIGVAEVELHNGKLLFPALAVWFVCRAEGVKEPGRLYLRHGLAGGEQVRLEWPLRFPARGEHGLLLSGVASRFPFGFLRKEVGAPQKGRVLVWPARVAYRFDPSSAGRRRQGEKSARSRGQGSDLLNIRIYERGDPPRLIHWKASARSGRLMVRQLADESSRAFSLQIETDAERWGDGRFEALCSLACSLAEDLFHAGRLERAMIDDKVSVFLRGVHDLHDFFDRVAGAGPSSVRGAAAGAAPPDLIRFRPSGETGIRIYLGDHVCGEIDA